VVLFAAELEGLPKGLVALAVAYAFDGTVAVEPDSQQGSVLSVLSIDSSASGDLRRSIGWARDRRAVTPKRSQNAIACGRVRSIAGRRKRAMALILCNLARRSI
jgi:hypothetical protein